MWSPLDSFNHAVSPFRVPISPPVVDPDDGGDLVTVTFNRAWLACLLGAGQSLLLPSVWHGTDAEVFLAIDRATLFLAQLAQGTEVQVGFTIAPSVGQYERFHAAGDPLVGSIAGTFYNLDFPDLKTVLYLSRKRWIR